MYTTYKDSDYEIQYKDIIYKVNKIHPLIEQKRAELFQTIINRFTFVVRKYINDRFLKSRYPINRMLETMLSRFMMGLLAKNNSVDPFFPASISSYEALEVDLMNKLIRDSSLTDELRKEIIDKIVTELNLEVEFRKIITILTKYAMTINETAEVEMSLNDKYVTLNYQGDKIDIYHKLYNKLFNRFKDTFKDDRNVYIWCLIKRYVVLRSYNNQLAVHKKIMKGLTDCHGVGFELFGSALNTHFTKYCSLFYDIEKHLGSYGSFFDVKIKKGSFTMNPPFDERVMRESMEKIVGEMKNSQQKILVVIWIPIWDHEGKSWVYDNCPGTRETRSYTKDYEALDVIKGSGLVKHMEKICAMKMTYFNYFYFKKSNAANTYNIVMSNSGDFEDACIRSIELKID